MSGGNWRRRTRARKVGIVLSFGLVVALLWVGTLLLLGAVDSSSSFDLPVVGFTVSAVLVEFLTGFVIGVVLGTVYVSFHSQIRQIVPRVTDLWKRVPIIAKAIIVGLIVAEGAELGAGLTHIYGADVPTFLRLGIFVLTLVITSSLTYQHLKEWAELKEWSISIVGGWTIAGGTALLLAWSTQLYYGSLVVFLLGWPTTAFVVYRAVRRSEPGPIREQLVKLGIVQWTQMHLLTVALVIGFVPAVLVGIGVQILTTNDMLTAYVFVSVWIVGLVVAYVGLRARERASLYIEEVRDRTSDENRELTVTNRGDEELNLHGAIIRDTRNKSHQLNLEYVLSPGETGRFTIPQEERFALNRTESGMQLLGFTIRQVKEPRIFTRTGERYKLQWSDDRPRGEEAETGTGADT